MQLWRRSEEKRCECCYRQQQVLAVVEHDQEVLLLHRLGQRVGAGTRTQRDVQRACDDRRQLLAVVQRGEINEPRTVGECGLKAACYDLGQ